MDYPVLDNLNHDGVDYAVGGTVTIDNEAQAETLQALGVIGEDVASASGLQGMTVAALKALAEAEQVTVSPTAKKADLIAAIEAARIARETANS